LNAHRSTSRTLFPYTTLFRSLIKMAMVAVQRWLEEKKLRTQMVMQVHDELVFDVPEDELDVLRENLPGLMCNVAKLDVPLVAERSEEHTSELQSRENLVCRLL